jgi:hypothetical protein
MSIEGKNKTKAPIFAHASELPLTIRRTILVMIKKNRNRNVTERVHENKS